MAGLYVDEHLGDLVRPLRDSGHDVVYSQDLGQGRTDAWHFREALESRRILLTLDKRDYGYFHRLWITLLVLEVVERGHAGILVAVPTRGFTQADWLPVLDDKLMSPESLAGRMFRWHTMQSKWYEDDWKPED